VESIFDHSAEVIPIGAIYDYKEFYDKYVPNELMIRKKEDTQLGWRISQLTDQERIKYPTMRVKVNYMKSAQGLSVDLRPKNSLYDPSSCGRADLFFPILVASRWIPINAKYDLNGLDLDVVPPHQLEGYRIGIPCIGFEILTRMPSGTPQPQAVRGGKFSNKGQRTEAWAKDHEKFVRAFGKHFPLTTYDNHQLHDQWKQDTMKYLPYKNINGVIIPSSDIYDYVKVQGSKFYMPLGNYLFGDNPRLFTELHHDFERPSKSPDEPQTATTSFHGRNEHRRSTFDQLMSTIVEQSIESIPRAGNNIPLGRYDFDFPERLQGVKICMGGTKFKIGVIVAFSPHDINRSRHFMV